MRGRRSRKEAADRMLALGRERGGKEGSSEHDIEEFYNTDGRIWRMPSEVDSIKALNYSSFIPFSHSQVSGSQRLATVFQKQENQERISFGKNSSTMDIS